MLSFGCSFASMYRFLTMYAFSKNFWHLVHVSFFLWFLPRLSWFLKKTNLICTFDQPHGSWCHHLTFLHSILWVVFLPSLFVWSMQRGLKVVFTWWTLLSSVAPYSCWLLCLFLFAGALSFHRVFFLHTLYILPSGLFTMVVPLLGVIVFWYSLQCLRTSCIKLPFWHVSSLLCFDQMTMIVSSYLPGSSRVFHHTARLPMTAPYFWHPNTTAKKPNFLLFSTIPFVVLIFATFLLALVQGC